MRSRYLKPLILSLLLLSITACGGGSTDSTGEEGDNGDTGPDPVTEGSWYRPAASVTWQWQLQGTINTGYDADLYDVDLFDTPEATIDALQSSGARVICYFSAGSYENYRDDAGDFLVSDLGNTLDGWPDEKWIDVRSSNVRAVMEQRLNLAQEKGCDGVEPDNMDGYTNNPGFNFSASDQLGYNRFIANAAHERGLSVGLKNDLDQINGLVDYYDFAVNEQCFEYDECDLLEPFIMQGKPVLNAEYLETYVSDDQQRAALCDESISLQFSTLVLPLDLDDTFRFSCM